MPNQRQFARKNLFFSASIRSHQDRCACDILNMSAGGARVHIDDEIEGLKDDGVVLTIDDYGDVASRVVWQEGLYLGIKFEEDPRRMHDQTMAMAIFDQD